MHSFSCCFGFSSDTCASIFFRVAPIEDGRRKATKTGKKNAKLGARACPGAENDCTSSGVRDDDNGAPRLCRQMMTLTILCDMRQQKQQRNRMKKRDAFDTMKTLQAANKDSVITDIKFRNIHNLD